MVRLIFAISEFYPTAIKSLVVDIFRLENLTVARVLFHIRPTANVDYCNHLRAAMLATCRCPVEVQLFLNFFSLERKTILSRLPVADN